MKGRSASGLWGVLSHWSSHDWRILEDYRKANGICKGPWILRIDDSCCLKALLWLLIISIIPLHPNARYDWIRKTYQSNTGTRFLGDTLWKVTWNRKNDAFQDGNPFPVIFICKIGKSQGFRSVAQFTKWLFQIRPLRKIYARHTSEMYPCTGKIFYKFTASTHLHENPQP